VTRFPLSARGGSSAGGVFAAVQFALFAPIRRAPCGTRWAPERFSRLRWRHFHGWHSASVGAPHESAHAVLSKPSSHGGRFACGRSAIASPQSAVAGGPRDCAVAAARDPFCRFSDRHLHRESEARRARRLRRESRERRSLRVARHG